MATELKHLLLVTTEDPFDVKAWSGIPWSLRRALELQVERLSVFRPPPPPRLQAGSVRRILRGAGEYPLWIEKATLKRNARAVAAEIARLRPDAVLSISSQCVAYLERPGVPMFLFSDAPYVAFCETYARWQAAPKRIGGFAAEEAAAGRRLDGLCFGSAWACAQARRLYGLASEATLHVTPLGANWTPEAGDDAVFARIEARLARLADGELELLYLGKDWERKGGPLAVEIAERMRAAGRRVRLHVVGCRPELGERAGPDGFVTVHGPLYQNDPEQSARLAELFWRSHFLVVPTLAECFGIVFAEAQAFGLPPVSRAVDAVPSIVLDGETGLLFAADAGAEVYAERMLALTAEPGAYRAMARRAREWFGERLTWERTAEGIVAAMRTSTGAGPRAAAD
jgi:glycosyltransferase involved in cell wall biosynthesis